MLRPALFALLLCLSLAVPTLGAGLLWSHAAYEPVRAVALSSDGNVTVVASDYLHVFNRSGSLLATSFPVKDVAIAPSGELFVAGSDDMVSAFAGNGTELWSQRNATAALAVSGDGDTIAVLGVDGRLSLYDPAGALIGTGDADANGEGVRVAISKSGSVVAATYERGIGVFSGAGGGLWEADLASPYAIAVNESGDLVAVGDGGSVTLFNSTGERLGRVVTGAPVRSLAMASGEDLIVAGVGDGSVLALGPGGELRWKRAFGEGATRVAVSESGSVVAATGGAGALLVYDRNGTLLWEVPLAGEARALALSADGTTVAVGTDEGTAYLFETGVTPAPAPTKSPRDATAARKASGHATPGARNETAPENVAMGGAAGDLAVTGNLTVKGNLTVEGDLAAGGRVTAGGTALDAETVASKESVTADWNRTAGKNLTGEEDPVDEDRETTAGDLVVEGDFTVGGDLTVMGDVIVGGDLAIGGDLVSLENETPAPNATVAVAPAITENGTAAESEPTTVSTKGRGASPAWYLSLPWVRAVMADRVGSNRDTVPGTGNPGWNVTANPSVVGPHDPGYAASR